MSPTLRSVSLIAFAGLLGATLRLFNLGHQVLGDDELHAVRAVLTMPARELFVTYLKNDHCIPLSLVYKAVLSTTGALTEDVLRSPAVITGLAMQVALPLVTWRRLGPAAGVVVAFLAALSPMFVFYSRIARPYAPMLLTSFVAVMAFESWWRTRRGSRAGAWILLAPLTVWLMPVSAFFVAAPVVLAAFDLVTSRGRAERPSLASLIVVGGLAASVLAGLLVPAHASMKALADEKLGEGHLDLSALGDVPHLMSGSTNVGVTLVFFAMAIYGLVVIRRRAPALVPFVLTLIGAHLLCVSILSPFRMQYTLVINRYLLIVLPLLLMSAAAGLAYGPWRSRPAVAALPAIAMLAALALTGPFVDATWWRSSFMHHNEYLEFTQPRATLADEHVPDFYEGLEGTVVEGPWVATWRRAKWIPGLQARHGQRVLVFPARTSDKDPRLHFRNMLKSPKECLASDARWFVLHDDMLGEEARLGDDWQIRGGTPQANALRARTLRQTARQLTSTLTRSWGDPVYRDDSIAAWDLEAVRAARE